MTRTHKLRLTGSLFTLTLSFIACGCGGSNSSKAISSNGPGKPEAWIAAKEYVKRELKSPTSAEFGWQTHKRCVTVSTTREAAFTLTKPTLTPSKEKQANQNSSTKDRTLNKDPAENEVIDKTVFTARGWVDSQDESGVVFRADFVVELEFISDRNSRLRHIELIPR